MDPRLESARLENRRQGAGEECRFVESAGCRPSRSTKSSGAGSKGMPVTPENERADALANRGVDSVL